MAFGDRITNAARDVMLMAAQRRAAAQHNEQQIDPLAAYNKYPQLREYEERRFNPDLGSPANLYNHIANTDGSESPGYKAWYDGGYNTMKGPLLGTPGKYDERREDSERKKYYDILNSWSAGYHYDGPPNGENYFGSLGPQYKRWYDGAYSRDGSMPGAVIRTPEALERSYRDGYEEWLDSINRRNRSW